MSLMLDVPADCQDDKTVVVTLSSSSRYHAGCPLSSLVVIRKKL